MDHFQINVQEGKGFAELKNIKNRKNLNHNA